MQIWHYPRVLIYSLKKTDVKGNQTFAEFAVNVILHSTPGQNKCLHESLKCLRHASLLRRYLYDKLLMHFGLVLPRL